jgi:hypothetical protein
MANFNAQSSPCQFIPYIISVLNITLKDGGAALVINLPSELKGFGRSHPGNVLAK